MSKALFLTYFQKNMKQEVENLIVNEWNHKNLTIESEKGKLNGTFNGFIDLCIVNKDNEGSIVAMEIEHLSSYKQAFLNIDKVKSWAHNSKYRRCGLLHVFNVDCNPRSDQIKDLVRFAKQNQKKDYGFYYDFVFYSVLDRRATLATAQELVQSRDFQTRLRMLMEDVEIV